MGGNSIFRLLFFPVVAASMLMAETGDEILKQVDHFRYPWPEFSVDVALQSGKAKQQWRVLVRENGDARVDGLSEREKKSSVLFLKDDMWLLLPKVKRPIKISPQQRMLGPAAGGDIARFRFAGDYAVTHEKEEELDGKPAHRLDLEAKSKKVTYQTAVLWVNPEGFPLKSDFFFASGKLARTAKYGPVVSEMGTQVLSSLRLEEPNGRTADLEFTHWKPVHPEDRLFQLPDKPE